MPSGGVVYDVWCVIVSLCVSSSTTPPAARLAASTESTYSHVCAVVRAVCVSVGCGEGVKIGARVASY